MTTPARKQRRERRARLDLRHWREFAAGHTVLAAVQGQFSVEEVALRGAEVEISAVPGRPGPVPETRWRAEAEEGVEEDYETATPRARLEPCLTPKASFGGWVLVSCSE
jgi:hypothetical protein